MIRYIYLFTHFLALTQKKKDDGERMHVCNVENRIEETLSLIKARAVIKENISISKYLNRQ